MSKFIRLLEQKYAVTIIMNRKGIRGKGKISTVLNSEVSGRLATKQSKKTSFLVIAVTFSLIWIFSIAYMGFKQGSIITVVLLTIFGFALIDGNKKSNESTDFKMNPQE